jgi:hypothetical protein
VRATGASHVQAGESIIPAEEASYLSTLEKDVFAKIGED